jgi:hypothetical protein
MHTLRETSSRFDLVEIGAFRRFGALGPAYRILGTATEAGFVPVEVIPSGEVFDYRLADLLADPPADVRDRV